MSDALAEQGTKKKTNRKKWILLLAATIVFGGGAGAATQFLKSDAEPGADAVSAPRKDTVFVPLDQFTVNLADTGGERLAQIAVTLEMNDDDAGTALKARMPSVRNAILLLISSKHAEELLDLEGKKKLAMQIATITGHELGWKPPEKSADAATAPGAAKDATGTAKAAVATPPNPVESVNFSHFIVQ